MVELARALSTVTSSHVDRAEITAAKAGTGCAFWGHSFGAWGPPFRESLGSSRNPLGGGSRSSLYVAFICFPGPAVSIPVRVPVRVPVRSSNTFTGGFWQNPPQMSFSRGLDDVWEPTGALWGRRGSRGYSP